MPRKFLVSLDLVQNELQNGRIQNLASAPASPVTGQIYYNTTDNILYFYNGTSWISTAGSLGSSATTLAIGGAAAAGTATTVSRSDHSHGLPAFGNASAQTSFGAASGNGSATTIARSDHTHGTPTHDNAAHSGINLSALAAPTGSVSFGSQAITNLADPTNAQDAATKNYVDSVAQGLDIKASVRAATTTAGTLASSFANGSVIDGVTLATGDRILIKNQATASENGIYTVNASGAPTRAADANVSSEVTAGLFVFVEEGTTLADTGWVLTTSAPITLGTTGLTFAQFSGAGTYVAGSGLTLAGGTFAVDTSLVTRKFATNIGNGAATSFTVNHNLGTRDVDVSIYLNSGTYEEVFADVERTDTNNVTIRTSVAPTSNQYRVVVQG